MDVCRDLYFAEPGAAPPARWAKAFPDGVCADGPIPASHGGPRRIWIPAHRKDWAARLRAHLDAYPDDLVVVLSDAPEATECAHALDLGARGYCHALATPAMLGEVATVLAHGGLWVGPELMAALTRAASRLLPATVAPPALAKQLSAREREVVAALVEGLSNKEIAARLAISERTVKAHLSLIFEIFGVRDRVQLLVRLAQIQAHEALAS